MQLVRNVRVVLFVIGGVVFNVVSTTHTQCNHTVSTPVATSLTNITGTSKIRAYTTPFVDKSKLVFVISP